MQQDLNKLQEQFKVLELEKEALKTSLKEEEVARIAAEGQIALPTSQEDDTELFNSPRKSTSPRKLQSSSFSDDKENVGVVTKKMVDTKRLQEEVDAEKQKREAAEEMVEFLRMECAFRCCDCTSTSRHGRAMRVSMDAILASSIQKMKSDIAKILTPPASEKDEDEIDAEMPNAEAERVDATSNPSNETAAETKDEIMGEDPHNIPLPEGDQSMTMVGDVSSHPMEEAKAEAQHETLHNDHADKEVSAEHDANTAGEDEVQNDHHQHEISRPTVTVPLKDSPPSTPPRSTQQDYDMEQQHQHSIRTITTTTRIPMHFTPVSKPSGLTSWGQENIPLNLDGSANCAVDDPPAALPFDREAALAAIAYRRGRAKSIADGTYTPRKQMVDLQRRDISAPVVGSNFTPKPRSLSSRSAGKGMRA
jgi:hypothetical protein